MCDRGPSVVVRKASGFLRAVGVRCQYAGQDIEVAKYGIPGRLPATGQALAVEWPDGVVRLVRLNSSENANQAAVDMVAKSGHPVAIADVTHIGVSDDTPRALLAINGVAHPLVVADDVYDVQLSGALGRLKLEKASTPNPLTVTGFDRIVASLSSVVRKAVGNVERDALDAWLKSIDFDWARATDAQLLAASKTLNAAMRGISGDAWNVSKAKLSAAAQSTALEARRMTIREHEWPISANLTAPDKAAIARSVATNAHYIRDYYGRLAPTASDEMRRIVEAGLEEGLGSYDIGRAIKRGVAGRVGAVSDSYYNVVANAVVGRSRSFSQLGSFRDAGIERYVYDAVLDEVTTDTCRFLHGQTMEVSAGLARYSAADRMSDPTDIQYEMPWTTERLIQQGDDAGKRGIYIPSRDGLKLMAVVEQSGYGSRNERGSFSRGMGTQELKNAHIGPPPLHARCRTVLLAVV